MFWFSVTKGIKVPGSLIRCDRIIEHDKCIDINANRNDRSRDTIETQQMYFHSQSTPSGTK
jgi:hypothetical protein